jgi:hypothetical protein
MAIPAKINISFPGGADTSISLARHPEASRPVHHFSDRVVWLGVHHPRRWAWTQLWSHFLPFYLVRFHFVPFYLMTDVDSLSVRSGVCFMCYRKGINFSTFVPLSFLFFVRHTTRPAIPRIESGYFLSRTNMQVSVYLGKHKELAA